MRRRRNVVIAVATVTWSISAVLLSVIISSPRFESTFGSLGLLALPMAAIGGFLAIRVRGNVVGWLLISVAFFLGSTALGDSYARSDLPGAVWAAWLASLLWLPALISLVVLVPLFFPDGRLPGPGWRWVKWTAGAGGLAFWVGNAFTGVLLDDYGFSNPTRLELSERLIEVVQAAGFLLILSSFVAGIAASIVRFRRSEGGSRQQMKWFAMSAVLLIPAVVVNGWAYENGRQGVGAAAMIAGGLAVSLAIGIAITHYRLYEIDRIISRTVSYALVGGLLALVFAAGVIWVPNVVPGLEDSPLAVAASTLAVAGLFNPLRRRVQHLVDRRFNRSRYDAEQVIEGFARSLRDQIDGEGLVSGWVGVVSETMQPASTSVWVRE